MGSLTGCLVDYSHTFDQNTRVARSRSRTTKITEWRRLILYFKTRIHRHFGASSCSSTVHKIDSFSIPDDVAHHPRRAYPGVQFHMRFSTTEFTESTESTENAVTSLCAKLLASVHASGQPGHSLASRHLLSRTVVEVNHALGRQVTRSRSTRASVTRQR